MRTRLILVTLALTTLSPAFAAEDAKPALQPAQIETLKNLAALGRAFSSWRGDQAGAAGPAATWTPPAGVLDWAALPALSGDEVEKMLAPRFLASVPRNDGWGHPFEFRLLQTEGAPPLLVIRSLGADGKAGSEPYTLGPTAIRDGDEDILWANGAFVRWPKR